MEIKSFMSLEDRSYPFLSGLPDNLPINNHITRGLYSYLHLPILEDIQELYLDVFTNENGVMLVLLL